ncbi:Protein ILITYHIA [Linum grandiflorum]
MADTPVDSLNAIAGAVSTSSTKIRVRIFREEIPPILENSDMSPDLISLLVDVIFKTLVSYDDHGSRKAVDYVITKAFSNTMFMKSFAAALVQAMEKQSKSRSHVGGYRLLKWSCLLLTKSQFASVSKNAVCRVAAAQALLLHIVMQRPFRERRACKRIFFHLFSQSPDLYKTYIEELKDARIPYKDSPELLCLLLEFSRSSHSFQTVKATFIDIYVKAVLSSREKPSKGLSDSFLPLFLQMSHEDFQNDVFPSLVKMLKRNPEILLESVAILLKAVSIDLSKFAVELLSVVLSQARHADETRRLGALIIVRCLSQKSSNPDALEAMFNAVKAVLGGSEGRLQFPYQRIGLFNSLQELSYGPDGKHLSSISCTVCRFLVSGYKDEGNEDAKLAILSAIGSWGARSADAIQPDLVSFLTTGLKEKEVLRRGHLRCLRVICKNPDAILQITSLLGPLIQLVKTGFTKAVQRLDGLYALLIVGKIAASEIKAEETLVKEKIWSLVSQNEPSVVQLSMMGKLSVEDSMACVDLLEVLLEEHSRRVLEAFPVKLLLQIMVFLLCHPSWDIRKQAHMATRKIITASPQLSESILIEFKKFLSAVAEKRSISMRSDADSTLDAQFPFVPSVEILVKTFFLISSVALASSSSVSEHILFCAHHPSILGIAKRDSIWKRLHRCLRTQGFDVIATISADAKNLCKVLLGPGGLTSSNAIEQEAAINSLSTLMSIMPSDIYLEFQKHLESLPDRYAHNMLSGNDIQVFQTPEGMLSVEQGVYVPESVIAQNMKQNHINSNHSLKREPVGGGKKEAGKATKKADKGKTAKEEARELLLQEEASIRERVKGIQKNLSLMLRALGEMATSNPVFAHSQLPSLVKFVDPLLRSPVVGDVAYETLVKLARCTAEPLCNWALDIATALRRISTEEVSIELDFIPSAGEGESAPSMGIFERIVNGLSISCKSGPLPVDSFTFVFPIMERILLSSKRTGLHDDVLRVLYMHMDTLLPLPRLRMLSALYHVLGIVPAYQRSVGPALNELCLGLRPEEIAPALYGVYAKDVHVRMACLNAIKCIPAVASRSIPRSVEVATGIWIALHDPEKSIAEAAEDIWDRYGHAIGTDYSGLLKALSHVNYNVRLAAAEALAAALDENPDSIQETLSTLFSSYLRDAGSGDYNVDAGWLGRQGISLALHSAADVLRTKDLPVIMTFLISRALADPNTDVRGRMINAGILIIDRHGKDNVSLLFPIFENYLNKKASDEETYDLVREGVVIFTGALAKHLAKDDPKVHAVVEKLLDVLNTPSEAVQRAVSDCLSPLMQSMKDDAAPLLSRLLDQLMKSDKYGDRRGAAFGLAGVVKGFGLSCLKKYGIIATLREGLVDRVLKIELGVPKKAVSSYLVQWRTVLLSSFLSAFQL